MRRVCAKWPEHRPAQDPSSATSVTSNSGPLLRSKSPRRQTRAVAGLAGLLLLQAATAGEQLENADGFLELASERDGRCQVLSQGGQLRVLYNRHQKRAIEYRLIRMFAGSHPQGRVAGIAPAGADGIKLGCTEVDGRPQDWVIERARFSE